MAELPELLHIVAKLGARLKGRHVTSDRVGRPAALHLAVPGNLSLLQGRRVEEVLRRSHLVVLRCEGLDLAVEPAPDGRLRLAEPKEADEKNLVLALGFGDGGAPVELRYLDRARRASAWLIAAGDWGSIPGLQHGGVEVLARAFTPDRLASLLRHGSGALRDRLLDRRAIDSLGPTYADEVLFEARLHPRTSCRALTREQVTRLHGAIGDVIRSAAEELARRDQPTEATPRDFLRLAGRRDCPRCGAALRTAKLRSGEARLCPACQPLDGARGA